MKIAIPLDENKTDVCMVLARAPFFLFWEDGQQTIAEKSCRSGTGRSRYPGSAVFGGQRSGPADYPRAADRTPPKCSPPPV